MAVEKHTGTVTEEFRRIAGQHRDELAIVDGESRISYGDLLSEIRRIRAGLKDRLNVSAGDVVAAALSNSWEFVACFLAVAELGGVFFPCNPQWRARENRWFASRLNVQGVVAEPQFRAEWDRIAQVMPSERVLAPAELGCGGKTGALDPVVASEDFPAAYLATSGSTGIPRIVPRSHRNLIAGARNVAQTLDIGPGHRFLSVVPFHHSNGFHNSLLMPLLYGARIVPMRNFAPGACAELARRERADVLIASPFIYNLLGGRPLEPDALSGLKLCISAGARMPASISERWKQRFGIRVRQLYGSTETSVISIDSSPGEHDQRESAGFVGQPIRGVDVRCIGPEGGDVKPGAKGELAIRSPAVMSGYLGEAEWNKRAFVDGFFRTGDLGHLDSQGDLYLAGRVRRVINVSGVKVDPVEVEHVLEALPGVSACHVDAVFNAGGGEIIRALLAVGQNKTISRGAIIEHCREHLAEYKLPRVIEVVEALPVTLWGKTPKEWSLDESD